MQSVSTSSQPGTRVTWMRDTTAQLPADVSLDLLEVVQATLRAVEAGEMTEEQAAEVSRQIQSRIDEWKVQNG